MNGVRRSRLAVRTCPECTAETLVSNGAFSIAARRAAMLSRLWPWQLIVRRQRHH